LTDGVPRPQYGVVEAQIARHPVNRQIRAVVPSGGQASRTHYRTVENFGLAALVECILETGRTHQARVHLRHVYAPVLCDADYGRRTAFYEADAEAIRRAIRTGDFLPPKPDAPKGELLLRRQGLHAWRLAFRHPADGRRMEFESPVPADMTRTLEALKR
jgi:23S rRNA pseudouridine1911/1915/1917 synthase